MRRGAHSPQRAGHTETAPGHPQAKANNGQTRPRAAGRGCIALGGSRVRRGRPGNRERRLTGSRIPDSIDGAAGNVPLGEEQKTRQLPQAEQAPMYTVHRAAATKGRRPFATV